MQQQGLVASLCCVPPSLVPNWYYILVIVVEGSELHLLSPALGGMS